MNRSALKRFEELGDGRDLVASALAQQLGERAAYMEAAAAVIDELATSHEHQLAAVGVAVGRLLAAVEKNLAVADARSETLQASAAPGKRIELIRDETGRLTGMREVPLAPDGLPVDGYHQRQIDDLLKDVDLDDNQRNER